MPSNLLRSDSFNSAALGASLQIAKISLHFQNCRERQQTAFASSVIAGQSPAPAHRAGLQDIKRGTASQRQLPIPSFHFPVPLKKFPVPVVQGILLQKLPNLCEKLTRAADQ
jgi:hypothetical protein